MTLDRKLGKLQEQLLGSRVLELNRCLGVFARSLYLEHSANAETLMLYPCSLFQA